MEKMIGYKAFNKQMICRGVQFEVGKRYKDERKPKLNVIGFTFCNRFVDCFIDYEFKIDNTIICEVVAHGEIISYGEKYITNDIEIIRKLDWNDVWELINVGKGNINCFNTGNNNKGFKNSGNKNKGDYNSGCRNDGNYNSGDINSGSYNSGHANTGNKNSGSNNSGDKNSGNANSGNFNSGCHNSKSFNSGHYNSGYYNSGNYNSGNTNVGHGNGGNGNVGCFNQGSYNIGCHNTADYCIGDFNTKNLDCLSVFNRPIKRRYFQFWRNSIVFEIFDSMNVCFKNPNGETAIAPLKGAYRLWWDNLNIVDKETIMEHLYFDPEIFKEITSIDVNSKGKRRNLPK